MFIQLHVITNLWRNKTSGEFPICAWLICAKEFCSENKQNLQINRTRRKSFAYWNIKRSTHNKQFSVAMSLYEFIQLKIRCKNISPSSSSPVWFIIYVNILLNLFLKRALELSMSDNVIKVWSLEQCGLFKYTFIICLGRNANNVYE